MNFGVKYPFNNNKHSCVVLRLILVVETTVDRSIMNEIIND